MIVFFLAGWFLTGAGAVWCASLLDEEPDKPWHISADAIEHDKASNVYKARGNVIISKPGRRLSAENVTFDAERNQAIAEGNAVMTVGGDVLSGERMEFDLESETGTVTNGTVFFKENHFYIRGEKLQKIGPATYTAERASFTTCDGQRPAWSISGSRVKVTVEGYGQATNAMFRIKNVPAFYSPFLVFPAKRDRQSGLLPPYIGYSDRNGFEYNQPFYWAISENTDATFYLDHIAERGERIGSEFRYAAGENSKGTLMFDFLKDDKIDDGTPEATKKWGYDHDRYPRTSEDRYWFRMKADQEMPYGLTGKLDLDIVSDQDYLREFKSGMLGFDRSDRYFYEAFGRDLGDYDDNERYNTLSVNKNWSRFRFSTGVLWEDWPVYRENEELKNTIVQQAPFVSFSGSKQQLYNSPLYWSVTSNYDYLHREDGIQSRPILRSHRADLYPKAYLPIRLGPYATFEPFFGFRGTIWNVDEYEEGFEVDKTDFSRTIYDTGAGLSSELYRIYSPQWGSMEKLKHIFRPFVGYTYVPEKDQSDLPYLIDEIGRNDDDRIAEDNEILYSLTSTWIAKLRKKTGAPSTSLSNKDAYEYRQFLRLYLEQRYDIHEAEDETKGDGEPYSPIYGRVDFSPFRYLTLKADAEYNPHLDEFNSYNYAASLQDERGDSLYAEHRNKIAHTDRRGFVYQEEETLFLRALIRLTQSLSLYGTLEEDRLVNDETVESGVGILYQAGCWSMNLGYIEEEDTQKYMVMFNLFGLGELGTQFNQSEFGN